VSGRQSVSGADLPRPDGYSDEQWMAYKEGYADAMVQIGQTALDGAAVIRSDDRQSLDDEADDEDDEDCRTCGQPLLSSMGADETAHSPAGMVCPDCDL